MGLLYIYKIVRIINLSDEEKKSMSMLIIILVKFTSFTINIFGFTEDRLDNNESKDVVRVSIGT